MMLEPEEKSSGGLAERELLARPEHDLAAKSRKVHGADRCRGEVVEREVAIRDRVDASSARHASKPSSAATASRSSCQLSPASAPEPSGSSAAPCRRGGEPRRVAVAASRSRRAGGGPGRPAGHAGGACSRASASRRGAPRARASNAISVAQQPDRHPAPLAHVQRQVGGDLVVARAAGVQLAAERTDELGQAPLDRHVDVLVALGERERPPPKLAGDRRRGPRAAASSSSSLEHAGACERPRVGTGSRDVVRRQAAVEADRGVESGEQPCGRSAKRGICDRPASYGAGSVQVSCDQLAESSGAAPIGSPADAMALARHRSHRKDRQRRRPPRSSIAATRSSRSCAIPRRRARSSRTRSQLARGDVTDPASLQRAAEGVEGAFNCMGLYEQWLRRPGGSTRVNGDRRAQRDRRRAARRAPGAPSTRPRSTSSTPSVAGPSARTAVADYPKGTAYERSKQRAEELVLGEARTGSRSCSSTLQPSTGPGPGRRPGVDGMAATRCAAGCPPRRPGGMTLVFVDDVAQRPPRRVRPRRARRALHPRRRLRDRCGSWRRRRLRGRRARPGAAHAPGAGRQRRWRSASEASLEGHSPPAAARPAASSTSCCGRPVRMPRRRARSSGSSSPPWRRASRQRCGGWRTSGRICRSV